MDNTQITVLVEHCVMQITPDPFFDNSTLANIRKLFRYVFQEPDRNTEAIAALGRYLPAKVAETKAAWGDASVAYVNGYVDTKFRYELEYLEKQTIERANKKLLAIERANKKLLAAVKHAKVKHEKYQKILTAFEAVKNKTPNVSNENN